MFLTIVIIKESTALEFLVSKAGYYMRLIPIEINGFFRIIYVTLVNLLAIDENTLRFPDQIALEYLDINPIRVRLVGETFLSFLFLFL